MAAENFKALVESVQGDRSVRQIAIEAGLELHSIQYLLRPGTTLRQMPTEERCRELARALGLPTIEVVTALRKDVGGIPTDDATDPQTRALMRHWERLPTAYRETLLQTAKSLGHLHHKMSQATSPESGECA